MFFCVTFIAQRFKVRHVQCDVRIVHVLRSQMYLVMYLCCRTDTAYPCAPLTHRMLREISLAKFLPRSGSIKLLSYSVHCFSLRPVFPAIAGLSLFSIVRPKVQAFLYVCQRLKFQLRVLPTIKGRHCAMPSRRVNRILIWGKFYDNILTPYKRTFRTVSFSFVVISDRMRPQPIASDLIIRTQATLYISNK